MNTIMVSVDREDFEMLKAYAHQNNISIAEATRRIIRDACNPEQLQRDAFAAGIMQKWDDAHKETKE